MTEPTSLYRIYDADGTLLYIGISVMGAFRIDTHQNQKWWWGEVRTITVEHYPDTASALAAEAEAIRLLGPLHNVAHNPRVRTTKPLEECPRCGRTIARNGRSLTAHKTLTDSGWCK